MYLLPYVPVSGKEIMNVINLSIDCLHNYTSKWNVSLSSSRRYKKCLDVYNSCHIICFQDVISFFGRQVYANRCCLYTKLKEKTHKVKCQYLLHGMLYFYNSCTILKPIHYYSVSDFNLDCIILHILLQPGGQRLNTFLM